MTEHEIKTLPIAELTEWGNEVLARLMGWKEEKRADQRTDMQPVPVHVNAEGAWGYKDEWLPNEDISQLWQCWEAANKRGETEGITIHIRHGRARVLILGASMEFQETDFEGDNNMENVYRALLLLCLLEGI